MIVDLLDENFFSFFCVFKAPQFAEEPSPSTMPSPSFGDYRQYQWGWRLGFCWGFLDSLLLFKKEEPDAEHHRLTSAASTF